MSEPRNAPGDTLDCGTMRGDLHRWFDGDLLDDDLARHVRDCAHCTTELERIEGQRDALASLSGGPRGAEAALDSSRRAAEAALADLVAELAEGCLVADDGARGQGGRAAGARPWSTVRAEVTLLAARLSQLGARIDLSGLPDRAPAAAERAAFARACSAVLTALEGATARSRALAESCAEQAGEA